MKKIIAIIFLALMAGCASMQLPAQEVMMSVNDTLVSSATTVPENVSVWKNIKTTLGLDWWGLVTIILGAFSLFAGTKLTYGKRKLREAIDLLQEASDAIEDNKINANERKDIVEKFKILISK